MQDEQLWLDEAEYETTPIHRLRKAPVAAAIAAAATLALVMAMPRAWIERAVYELYIDTVIPAAELPLGDMAHAVVAFVAAAIVAMIVFTIGRFVDVGRLLRRSDPASSSADESESASPRLRRADSHPDAPPRAPFRVGAGFDEDDRGDEDFAVESADDPAAMADDDADDEMFDLGGFEAGDADGFDAPPASAIFDVAAIEAPGEGPGDEPREVGLDDEEPLRNRDVAVDPMADVREKFADMFGPDDTPDEDVSAAGRGDLSTLTTGQLIDELERRIAARNVSDAAEHGAQSVAAEQDDDVATPSPLPQRQDESAANDQTGGGGDLDDMDAALQAALGTLARMQKSSAG